MFYFQAISYRARHSQHCSPTILFFDECCFSADLSVYRLINALEKIGNIACKRVLSAWLGKLPEMLDLFWQTGHQLFK